mgnify:CR=1 FL=1
MRSILNALQSSIVSLSVCLPLCVTPLVAQELETSQPKNVSSENEATDSDEELPPEDVSAPFPDGSRPVVQIQPPAADERRNQREQPSGRAPAALNLDLFGTAPSRTNQRTGSRSLGVDVVRGTEAVTRATSDGGSLLGKSNSTNGVTAQRRTPVITDLRIRGARSGQILASGSYYAPARVDLDTMLSKFDSRMIDSITVIKGPYSVRNGPGFEFLDVELTGSPRYEGGYESEATTGIQYLTNGEQWYGRQSVQAGNNDWGVRFDYGHRTGSDYSAGRPFGEPGGFVSRELPSSYNSRYMNFAYGKDIDESSSIEISYLRLDQTGVEFPGLIFDINFLVTDGFDFDYDTTDLVLSDSFHINGWYNRTRFAGDTLGVGKNRQIPTLSDSLSRGYAITDVDGMSTGYRSEWTWDDSDDSSFTLGTDLIYLTAQLNDIEPDNPPSARFDGDLYNFPIPDSYSRDVGFFIERKQQLTTSISTTLGARVDLVQTDAPSIEAGNVPYSQFQFGIFDQFGYSEDELRRQFTTWATFLKVDKQIDDNHIVSFGVGHAQRPPNLTELYADQSFIGSLQSGITAVIGDPFLKPERLTQLDLGFAAEYEKMKLEINGFHSWINDYIIFENLEVLPSPGEVIQFAAYGNTELATLAGGEIAVQYELSELCTAFGMVSYVAGHDHTRNAPVELSNRGALLDVDRFETPDGLPPEFRGDVDVEDEPLAGMPPMNSLVGLRWQSQEVDNVWGAEISMRIASGQDRVASSLYEFATPGFSTWDVRAFRYVTPNYLITAGVENFANRFYREHLDFRPGRGVYQPGRTFFFGSELTY